MRGDILNDFQKITVIRVQDRKKGDPQLIIKNPTKFPLIGNGGQGAVFKLSKDRCVKIYAKAQNAQNEGEALKITKNLSFTPQVYKVGTNYVIMDYIKGTPLDKFLKKKKQIPISLTKQILSMLEQLENAGFTRIDARLRHLFLTKNKQIKAVDHVNAFLDKPPYPKNLLFDLKKIGLKKPFLLQVKQLDSKLYKQWKNHLT